MKRLFSYISILFTGLLILASCTDDTFSEGKDRANGQVGLKLALNLPGSESASTRTGGTDATTDTENGGEFENLIQADDVRLLLFSNGVFAEEVANLKIRGVQGNIVRYLEGTTSNPYEGKAEIVVLTNLKSRGVNPESTSFAGKTVEEVYQSLEYTYGDEAWKVNEDSYIPMWGSLTMNLQKGKVNEGRIDLYRAISKINMLVNEGKGLENFELRSIRVYFANTKGYCAPLPSDATIENAETQFVKTSIPTSSTQRSVTNPLSYDVKEGAYIFENQIYIPESNNKEPGTNKKPLCLVVGGIYHGEGLVESGKESYYRIDFKDDFESGNEEDLRVYDVIRNHSYVFNIRSVTCPGTTTPEEALDNLVVGMNVSIEEWVDVPIRGIPDQYTLTTDKGWVEFDKDGNDISNSGTGKKNAVKVWTDFNLTDAASNGQWSYTGDANKVGDWFTVTSDKDYVYITAQPNYGITREGHFFVQAGNLRKQINVYQSQPPTANCYVVSDDKEHDLIVIIKGNGIDGTTAIKDKSKEVVDLLEEGQTDASLNPAKIGIIWETKAGLVTLIDKNGREVTGGDFITDYDKEKGIIKYKVDINATIEGAAGEVVKGGNALIGAFDNNGTILWSWHIWVCPDLADENGNIKDKYVENWTLTKYHVMDRNLGALDNQPGVGSLGLLYQWGRKDPFIGANATNDDYYKYPNDENATGVLNTVIYHGQWGIGQDETAKVSYTVKNPTTLTYSGLSENTEDKRSALLWGTDGGLNTAGVIDLGTKTIYDPCPIGYRIPPVDAFVFKTRYDYPGGWGWGNSPESGTKSSNVQNWNENLIYIPDDGEKETEWNRNNEWKAYYKESSYIRSKIYGFYLNYSQVQKPVIDKTSKTTYKYWDNKWYDYYYETTSSYYDKLKSYDNITWLPISGAYDPQNKDKKFSFKGVNVQQGSSLSVNSFLWTNSSVKVGNKGTIPAAMFLHGTENGGNAGSGRHIHGMTQSNIYAEPHYAGAVRCIRTEEKDFSESNKVPTFSTFHRDGETKTAEGKNGIVSINETWTVIDSGAPWISVFPESGTADKGRGHDFEVTVKANNTETTRSATIVIQFSRGSTKTIRIEQN